MDRESEEETALLTIEKPKLELDLKINLKQVDLNARLDKQREVHEFIRVNEDNFEKMEKSFADALSFILINYSFEKKHMKDFLEMSTQYDFVKTLCNLLEKSLPTLDKILASSSNDTNKSNLLPIFITYTIVSIIKSFSTQSNKFRVIFKDLNGIELLFRMIDNELLLAQTTREKCVENTENNFPYRRLIRCCLGTLMNFCRDTGKFVTRGEARVKCIESLINCSSKLTNEDDLRLLCSILLAFIVNFKDSLRYEIKCVIPELVNVIAKIVDTLKNKKFNRIKVHLGDEDRDEAEISFCNISSLNLNLVSVLKALYRLAMVDGYKYFIYFEHKMCEYLRVIIHNGNNVELEHALTLLYQLCFELRICKDVYGDKDFYEKIIELQQNQHLNLINIANGLIWLLKNKNGENENEYSLRTESASTKQSETLKFSSDKHIMISHSIQSRDICLNLKEELEKMKYKVWLKNQYVNDMKMITEAIQNSMCVIICLTEVYKECPNSRAEAEYVFELNKPIIPLVFKNNFESSGWLDTIIASRNPIVLLENNFEESLKQISEDIKQLTVGPKSVSFQKTKRPVVITKSKTENQHITKKKNPKKVLDWTESQVSEWLKEKKIHKKIVDNITPCNGKLLSQLYSIKSEAPEFFYHSVASNKTLSTIDIVLFVSELTNLFGK